MIFDSNSNAFFLENSEGLFAHVCNDQQFEDGTFYYRFNNPDTAAQQKTARELLSRKGWLERKGLGGWTPLWWELTGNIVKFYDYPQGKLKGKFNVLGCTAQKSTLHVLAFDVNFSGSMLTLSAESETDRDSWIKVLSGVKGMMLEERSKLLEPWLQQKDCVTCLALVAKEQEEQEENKLREAPVDGTLRESMDFVGYANRGTLTNSNSGRKKQDPAVSEIEALSAMFALPIQDSEGISKQFKDIFTTDLLLVALLRHFG